MDTERDFTCSGEIKLPCAKVLAFGQNVCTAQKRRQPEGRLGALSEPFAGSENIQIGVQFQTEPVIPQGMTGFYFCWKRIAEQKWSTRLLQTAWAVRDCTTI